MGTRGWERFHSALAGLREGVVGPGRGTVQGAMSGVGLEQ